MDAKKTYDRARNAHDRGEFDTARDLYRLLLEHHPNSAETMFHLGRMEVAAGHAKRGRKHLLKALKVRPQEPAIWMALLDVEIAGGSRKEIARLMNGAKAARLPQNALRQLAAKASTMNRTGVANLAGADPQQFNRAAAAFKSGDVATARAICESELKRHPKSAPMHTIRAACLAQMREMPAARDAFETAIRLDPGYAEARLHFGQFLSGIGDYVEGNVQLTQALELAPKSPFAIAAMGVLQAKISNWPVAVKLLEDAFKSLPNEPRIPLYLAQTYHGMSRSADAEAMLAKVNRKALPETEQAVLASVLTEMGRTDEARTYLKRLLKASPDSPTLISAQAALDTSLGNVEAMQKAVRRLAEMNAATGNELLQYARSMKMDRDDPIPVAMEKTYRMLGDQDETKTQLAFALAKALDDQGEYAKSFKYLRSGNDHMAKKTEPSFAKRQDAFDIARGVFENRLGKRPDDIAETAPRMIWISGMPRSGTTLVEQIVSSHSAVTAGGELDVLSNRLQSTLTAADAAQREISADAFAKIRTDILGAYADRFPEAATLTDKAIFTNTFGGLLPYFFPESRTVILLRDPRDNCLSIYKNLFRTGSHSYSTDLEMLAKTYLHFLDTLSYWRQAAPGSMYEIRYEDLIEEPEEESRKLIDYCGLEWEDACLEFYKNTRRVTTLSAFQVRQKIYSSSVGAWKHYEKELQPLIRILEDGGALEDYRDRG